MISHYRDIQTHYYIQIGNEYYANLQTLKILVATIYSGDINIL